MSRFSKRKKPKFEVADILRKHIGDYQNSYTLWPDQHRIVSHLLNCRTAATTAVLSVSDITLAVTGIAPPASTYHGSVGLKHENPNCCRLPTSTSYLRCPMS
jgi:hypothetical protein